MEKNRWIYLCKKFRYSKNLLHKWVAGNVNRFAKGTDKSNFNLPTGSLGKALGDCFPSRVRVNRHHRKRFKVEKVFESFKRENGEYFGHPAKINYFSSKINI